MKTAFVLGLAIYAAFVLAVVIHTVLAWRENERLHEMKRKAKLSAGSGEPAGGTQRKEGDA